MAPKNTDRMVNLGDRKYIDFYTIKGVMPAESAPDDDFSSMMGSNGLFPISCVILEDGSTLGSSLQVEEILQRIDAARDLDVDEAITEASYSASVETMRALGNSVEECMPPDADPDTVAMVRDWLFNNAEANESAPRTPLR